MADFAYTIVCEASPSWAGDGVILGRNLRVGTPTKKHSYFNENLEHFNQERF